MSDARALRIGRCVIELLDALEIAPVDTDRLLTIADAAKRACTSVRVIREAVAAGSLPAFGRRRDRAVRSSDLDRWIESRRVKLEGPEDLDIARRIRRLSRVAR